MLYYRHFTGSRSGVPVLILHGSAYYDSYDWITVASALSFAGDVAAFDARGFGKSSRSPTADYSHDANVADIIAVLDHLGWRRAILVGHSRGGAYATLAASRFPERAAGLVLIDHCPGIGTRGRGAPPVMVQTIGQKAPRFSDLEAALAATSRSRDLSNAEARERLLSIFSMDNGCFVLTARDPNYQNPIPLTPSAWPTSIAPDVDLWSELAKIRVPILVLRALQSNAYSDAALERMRRELPGCRIAEVDSGHDMAAEAPDAIVNHVLRFSLEIRRPDQ